jgi:type IV secretion system protein VirB9
MIRLLAATALSLALAAPAYALEQTHASPRDARVRSVAYEPNNIAVLKTTMGNVLTIKFAPDETIVRVAVPDSARLKDNLYKNFLFLKPERLKDDPANYVLPSQTIVVLTDKGGTTRNYQYEFEAQAAGGDPDTMVDMTYPHDTWVKRQAALRAARERRERQRTRELLQQEANPSAYTGGNGDRNYRYIAQGDRNLAPIWAWDNGFSTYFVFPAMQRIPSIYRIDPSGKEATSDYSVHGDTVMLPGTAPEWRLRDGQTVLDVWNLGYSPYGMSPQTGTASPRVRRVLRTSADGR